MKLKKEEIKKLIKPFLVVFLISFLIINWNEVSWIFNYKVISRAISDFFQKNNIQPLPNNPVERENQLSKFEYTEKENSLEIPKIEIEAPLIFVSDEKEVYKSLDRGVVHFPNSVLPGESGQTIILGHSAPPDWPKIKYDWVFSRLNELNEGDEVFVYFNNRKYSYAVGQKFFLDRGEEIPERNLASSKNRLILISCWPPGKDYKRIAVEAILK